MDELLKEFPVVEWTTSAKLKTDFFKVALKKPIVVTKLIKEFQYINVFYKENVRLDPRDQCHIYVTFSNVSAFKSINVEISYYGTMIHNAHNKLEALLAVAWLKKHIFHPEPYQMCLIINRLTLPKDIYKHIYKFLL